MSQTNTEQSGTQREPPVERIARRFHEVYEELAPSTGWQTQERSRVPWDDVPFENKSLMVKVVSRLLSEGIIDRGRRS